jgi:hypothetical protein
MEAINEMLQPYAIWMVGVIVAVTFGKIWDERTELLKKQHQELMNALERQGRVS